jgi:hypothetical protein
LLADRWGAVGARVFVLVDDEKKSDKSREQVVRLLQVLDCEVDLVVR